MKKVWTRIKFEFAFVASEMWSAINKYVFEHNKSFNKTVRKIAWNMHMHWVERSLELYEKMNTE